MRRRDPCRRCAIEPGTAEASGCESQHLAGAHLAAIVGERQIEFEPDAIIPARRGATFIPAKRRSRSPSTANAIPTTPCIGASRINGDRLNHNGFIQRNDF